MKDTVMELQDVWKIYRMSEFDAGRIVKMLDGKITG